MQCHLILGGLGFIGRHVAAVLAARGERVTIIDHVAPSQEVLEHLETVGRGRVNVLTCDLATADWPSLLAGIDVVHHYAWSTIPQTANEAPVADLDQNVRSTLRLLEAMRRGSKPRLVFASSGGTVYGRLRKTPVPESHPFAPISAYGVSKVAVELYMGFYRDNFGLDCRIARISNPFGAGQDPARLQGAASAFLFKALAGEEITIWGDGSVVRDFIHITDLSAGLVTLALAPKDACGLDPIFNIGSGAGISLIGIIATLTDHLETAPVVQFRPGRPFDIPVSVLDISQAKERLGWEPQLTFAEGCDRMIRDIRAGRMRFSTL